MGRLFVSATTGFLRLFFCVSAVCSRDVIKTVSPTTKTTSVNTKDKTMYLKTKTAITVVYYMYDFHSKMNF